MQNRVPKQHPGADAASSSSNGGGAGGGAGDATGQGSWLCRFVYLFRGPEKFLISVQIAFLNFPMKYRLHFLRYVVFGEFQKRVF